MLIRKRLLSTNGIQVELYAPYYDELVTGNNEIGRLPADAFGAHALWNYYVLASMAKHKADRCMARIRTPPVFDLKIARQIFEPLQLAWYSTGRNGQFWG